MGTVATSSLPSRGSRSLQSGGQNQKWPAGGQSGYVTPAISRIPTASERGAKSEVAHKWAQLLRHPCQFGDPHRFRAGGGNQTSPTSGQSGYVNPAVSRDPTASERGGKLEVAHKWAKWLRHPCRLGGPRRFRAGGENQAWPTVGQRCYVTPAVWGIPAASERGGKSEVAHKWAQWLPHPCRLGDPTRCRAGRKIRSGPQVGTVATSLLPIRGSPPLQSGGRNQKWPACGQSAYVTPAVSGIPTVSERGEKSEVGHKWAQWLRHPCQFGDPHRFRAGGGNQTWPTSWQSGYVTPAVSGIPNASERGGNQKWPTSGQSGYVTPAFSGIPTVSERGEKSEVAHMWAKWLRRPCQFGDPQRFRAGGGGGF